MVVAAANLAGKTRRRRQPVHLADSQQDLLAEYLEGFRSLIGDRRTQELFRGTIEGIINAQSLICSKVAASSPSAGHPAQRRAADSAHG